MALNILLYIFYFHRVLNYEGVLTFGGRVPGNGDFTSILAFGSEPAALRNPQKKATPDFTSILAFSSEPAALRNPQKKAIPDFTSTLALWSEPAALRNHQKKAIPQKSDMYPDFLNMYSPFWGMHPPHLGWSVKAKQISLEVGLG